MRHCEAAIREVSATQFSWPSSAPWQPEKYAALQCEAVCRALRQCTALYPTTLHCTHRYCAALHTTTQYCTAPCDTTPHNATLHSASSHKTEVYPLHCTPWQVTTRNCTVLEWLCPVLWLTDLALLPSVFLLQCSTLQYTALYCIILLCSLGYNTRHYLTFHASAVQAAYCSTESGRPLHRCLCLGGRRLPGSHTSHRKTSYTVLVY